jgi:hypothetical protein
LNGKPLVRILERGYARPSRPSPSTGHRLSVT